MTPWTFLLILTHAWFCHVDFPHILLLQGLNSVPINAHWKLIFVVWVTESRSIWPSLWKKNYLLKPSHTPIWLAYSNEKKQVQSCTFSDGQSQDTGKKLSCSQQTTQITVWVALEETLIFHLVQPPRPRQWHLLPDQAAQSLIQPHLKDF